MQGGGHNPGTVCMTCGAVLSSIPACCADPWLVWLRWATSQRVVQTHDLWGCLELHPFVLCRPMTCGAALSYIPLCCADPCQSSPRGRRSRQGTVQWVQDCCCCHCVRLPGHPHLPTLPQKGEGEIVVEEGESKRLGQICRRESRVIAVVVVPGCRYQHLFFIS